MIIITVGAARGLENGVKADMGNDVANSMFAWTMSTSIPYKGYQRGRWLELDIDDVKWLEANTQHLDLVCPEIQLGGWQGTNNVIHGKQSGAFDVSGAIARYQEVKPMNITSGRFLNQADLDAERKVCVIGSRVQDILFEFGENPLLDGDQHDVRDADDSGQQCQRAEQQRDQAHARKQQFRFLELLRHGPAADGPGIVRVDTEPRLDELLRGFLGLLGIHAVLDQHGQPAHPVPGVERLAKRGERDVDALRLILRVLVVALRRVDPDHTEQHALNLDSLPERILTEFEQDVLRSEG